MEQSQSQDLEALQTLVSPDVADAVLKNFAALDPPRRFWAPLIPTACKLCPSMDLMVVGLEGGSLVLYRTIKAQKLATINLFETTGDSEEIQLQDQTVLHSCFRPDGRVLAVCLSSRILLYPIENLLASEGNGQLESRLDGTESSGSAVVSLPLHDNCVDASLSVSGLDWAHYGNPHPAWRKTEEDEESTVYWKYVSRFCDLSTVLLPPSDYHNPQHAPDHHKTDEKFQHGNDYPRGSLSNSILPSSRTPLSVLCLVTHDELLLYSYGCNRVMSTPLFKPLAPGTRVDVAVSNNLSHFILYPQGSQGLTIYSVPELARQRYTLQMLSALTCSMQAHIHTIESKVHAIAASWKSSLKPLDAKLDLLANLLSKYGFQGSMTAYLVQYILSGSTRAAPSLANVMDQFFTHIQMNDQLLVRMENSLSVAVQNVETEVRRSLLSPAQALLYQTNELVGLAMANNTSDNAAEGTILLDVDMAKKLQRCCSRLYLAAETSLTELIDARFRLKDLCAWLRSVGSQIKAHGTALNSVQRQNAKARRVSDAVVERMLKYLQTEEVVASGLTEVVLGLRCAGLWTGPTEPLPGSSSQGGTEIAQGSRLNKHAKLGAVPELTSQAALSLSDLLTRPQQALQASMEMIHVQIPSNIGQATVAAITTRLGRGGADPADVLFGEELHDGFFAPLEPLDAERNGDRTSVPDIFFEWCIFAEATSSGDDDILDTVRLSALPLSYSTPAETSMKNLQGPELCWTTILRLPRGSSVLAIKFYGDDGKSSLSSGQNSGTGKERRQALGLLVEQCCGDRTSKNLWLVSYDDCVFYRRELAVVSDIVRSLDLPPQIDERCCCKIEPMTELFGTDAFTPAQSTTYAMAREIQLDDLPDMTLNQRFLLSGSRGVAAILTNASSLQLYDLEEDEAMEESESLSVDNS